MYSLINHTVRALTELCASGQIDAFGIGVNEIPICLELLHEADFDAILLAGRYTLLEQNALDALFPECARRGTSLIIGGPYNSGILATGTRGTQAPRFDYEIAATDTAASTRTLNFEIRRQPPRSSCITRARIFP